MSQSAAPSFMDAMNSGFEAIESGEMHNAPVTPAVDDNIDAAGESGAGDEGADESATGADDAGADGGPGGAAEGDAGAPDGQSGAGDTAEDVSARKAAAANRERNPDGTFKTAEQKAAEAAAVAKPDAAAAAAAKPKIADPINDPIPVGLKPATAERMGKLIETAKAVTAERDEARGQLDGLIQSVVDTGMNGQQFGEFLAVVGDARSDDPARLEKSFKFFTGVVAELAEQLGKAAPGQDELAGHDDLAARVMAGNLLRKDAVDIANARRHMAASEARQQQVQQRQQYNSQRQVEYNTAVEYHKAQMRELEQTLAAADPQFAAKRAILAGDAAFINTLRAAQPTQWVAMFNKKYRETKIAAAAAAPGNTGGNPRQQPLRGKAPAGGNSVTAAKTIEQAIGSIDFSKI